MSQREIEIRCACLIANLEGRKQLHTTGYNDPPYLEDLDRRLRFIELRHEPAAGIAPPTQAPTWESLAWRICRLDGLVTALDSKGVTKSHFGSLLPEAANVEFDTLFRIVDDLMTKASCPPGFPPSYPMQMPPLPKLVDDEEKLDILCQRLFYVAGKRQYRVTEAPLTKRDAYILAADLSLNSEPLVPPGRGVRPRGLPGSLHPPPIVAGKKMCCGCCNCACHRSSRPLGFRAQRKKSKFNGFFGFGWLKSLACWRKKKVDDTSSSSSDSLFNA